MDEVNLSNLVKESEVNALLHTVVDTNSGIRYAVFTKLQPNEIWCVNATDGVELWQGEYDKKALFSLTNLVSLNSIKDLLMFIRSEYMNTLNISKVNDKLVLYIGKDPSTVTFDLTQATDTKNAGLKYILFHLADRVTSLESELNEAKRKLSINEKDRTTLLAPVKPSSTSSSISNFNTSSPKKRVARVCPKVGMSILNPLSRKRKPPSGIDFGE